MLLTGDQIYADDVAASLLMVLSDAAHVLLGWKEQIPFDDQGSKADVDKLLPFLRRDPLEAAGFTSEDLDGQLLSLGEYLCMYIMVWSDVLWPADMPTFSDVTKATGVVLGGDPVALGHWLGQRAKKGHDLRHDQAKRTQARAVPPGPPGRAPDAGQHPELHDLRRPRGHRRLEHDARHLQVALRPSARPARGAERAGGLFAVPALGQRAGGVRGHARRRARPCSTCSTARDAARYEANSPALRKLVAVHEESVLATRPDNAVFHDPDSLIFNFTVEGPGHQVIFTDSRSWRSFPTGRVGGGVLLPSDQLAKQIVGHAAGRRPVRDRGDDHQRAGRGADPLRRPARLHHQPRRSTTPMSTRRGSCRRSIPIA